MKITYEFVTGEVSEVEVERWESVARLFSAATPTAVTWRGPACTQRCSNT